MYNYAETPAITVLEQGQRQQVRVLTKCGTQQWQQSIYPPGGGPCVPYLPT